MRVRAEQDKSGTWWVRGRINPSGVLRVPSEEVARQIVNAVQSAYDAGREDALQAFRDLLNVPVRTEGQD